MIAFESVITPRRAVRFRRGDENAVAARVSRAPRNLRQFLCSLDNLENNCK